MKLTMTVTFDPFVVSAPNVQVALIEAGIKVEDIKTGTARAPRTKAAKAK